MKINKMIMKLNLTIFLTILFTITLTAQNLDGSYQRTTKHDNQKVTNLLLISGDYFAQTTYQASDGAFIATKGGKYMVKDGKVHFFYEFDTQNPDNVGTSNTKSLKSNGKKLKLADGKKWKSISYGKSSPIQGPWLITSRKRGEEMQPMDTTRTRKTMKILTATHFQWIAFDSGSKKFMGSGGGSYTATNGKYVENIEFFSRDDSRVGASLSFDFEVKDGHWHHSGLSSKGKPIYEVWSIRK